jgi:protein-disulfide isomerase
LRETYIKTGKVKLVYRNFTRDRLDLAVSMITRCFGPDKTFDLMGLYFQRQRQWAAGEDAMTEIAAVARKAGISRLDLDACLANTELQTSLLDMLKKGQGAGINGTPTFLINGEEYVGSGSIEIFSKMFESKL